MVVRLFAVSLILIVWCLTAIAYLGVHEERTAYNIKASQEPDLAASVYAQFVYTEVIYFAETHYVHELRIPFFFPTADVPFTVTLMRNTAVVQQWQEITGEPGVRELSLILTSPALLDGTVEIQVAAPTVPADRHNDAPRVFIEKDATAFPDGHYRVADNVKSGNISLRFYERVTRGQVWQEKLRGRQRDVMLAQIGLWLALMLLTLQVPWFFGRGATQSGPLQPGAPRSTFRP